MPLHDYEGTDGIFSSADLFSEACLKHYDEEGWILVKGFFDIERDIFPIFRHINALIDLKLREVGVDAVDPVDQRTIKSNNFLALCAKDRAKGGEIYRACRHLLPLQQMLVRPENVAMAEALIKTDLLNIIPYTAVRIDIRGEEQYLFEWHQDYPYIQGSQDGVVVWTPLRDCRKGDGGVKLIPRSHKQGIVPIRLVDPRNENRNGAHSIEIADLDALERADAYRMEVEVGDALIFHTLLLHKSLPMEQGDVRWSTQQRYTNFRHPDAIARGWPGGMIEGSWFEQSHPEFIVQS